MEEHKQPKDMNQLHQILTTLFLFLVCIMSAHGDEAKVVIEYTCEVPIGLSRKIGLPQKDGSTEEIDAHKAYKYHHAEGWDSLMRHYAETGISEPEPHIAQTWALMLLAHDIGGLEARTLILKAELIHGEEATRIAAKRFLLLKEDSKKYEKDDYWQPAFRPESKSEDGRTPPPEPEESPGGKP